MLLSVYMRTMLGGCCERVDGWVGTYQTYHSGSTQASHLCVSGTRIAPLAPTNPAGSRPATAPPRLKKVTSWLTLVLVDLGLEVDIA